jgi:hypothetical protein
MMTRVVNILLGGTGVFGKREKTRDHGLKSGGGYMS